MASLAQCARVATVTSALMPGRSATPGVAVEADEHRDALHDLDEVARGVVRREQREARARGAGEALDVPGEVAAPVGVDLDRRPCCPARISASWSSLKLATTQTSSSGTSARSGALGRDHLARLRPCGARPRRARARVISVYDSVQLGELRAPPAPAPRAPRRRRRPRARASSCSGPVCAAASLPCAASTPPAMPRVAGVGAGEPRALA